MEKETGQIVTFVGKGGSGKTTQIRRALHEPGFRLIPSVTTRPPRDNELAGEYRYYSAEAYQQLVVTPGRLLWDVIAGNGGNHYGKDAQDIEYALAHPEAVHLNALVPSSAQTLVDIYGPDQVRTIYLPDPGNEILLQRMIERGDNPAKAAERLNQEDNDGWEEQTLAIAGLHIVQNTGVESRHQEIMALLGR